MILGHRPAEAPPTDTVQENYLISVGDMMAGLLFVFLIMLMAFALRFKRNVGSSQTTV